MSDRSRAECQRYLTEFRVVELKELLKVIGVSQKGRKSELFHRANELLIRGSPKVQQQIREVYERAHKVKRAPRYGGKMVYSPQYPDMKGMMHHHTPKSQFGSPASSARIPHPDIKFKPHPFFELVDLIIRPTTLLNTDTASGGSCSMRLQFHLSPQQVKKICSSRTAQGDYGTQVLLRLARNESSCEQEDFYPKQCYIKVNGNYCTLPGYNPQLSVRPDYKRTGTPINITNLVKTSASLTNDITFYWHSDMMYPQGFCVEVTLVRSLSSSDLLQELKLRGIRSPDVSRALVKEKLAVDRDSEISATSLRVSLLCPLGKLRMTHPCRSQMCNHLQCFDASIYLQMNEKKARWVCPVCDKPAPMESLVVDGLFKEICAESTYTDIEFYSDGSWHPIGSKDEWKPVTLENLSPVTVMDSTGSASPDPGKSEGTMSNPIVIDEEDDDDGGDEVCVDEANMEMEEDASESAAHISSSHSAPSLGHTLNLSTPHIVNPSHSSPTMTSTYQQRPSSEQAYHRDRDDVSRDGISRAYHRDDVSRDGIGRSSEQAYRRDRDRDGSSRDRISRSVVVKRRFSSTTDGGAEASHECSNPFPSTTPPLPPPPATTTTTTTTTAAAAATPPPPPPTATNTTTFSASDTRNHLHTTAPVSIPVITEYAPTLPYLNAPLLPFLGHHQSVRTLLASSDSHLTSAVVVDSSSSNNNSNSSGIGGGGGGGSVGSVNLDDLQHLPALNYDNLFTLIHQPSGTRTIGSAGIIIED